MAKFVYIYVDGQLDESPEGREKAMQAWGAWFGTLGDAVHDMGNPFGASATVTADRTSEGGRAHVGGYSIVTADSIEAAGALTKGCPVLDDGGSVEVYEALAM